MSDRKRVCVFCGSTPLSREHVWPQWLRKIEGPSEVFQRPFDHVVPKVLPRRIRDADGKWIDVSKTRRHSAPSMDLAVRVACRGCNSGWMSRLEQQVKPLLISILDGRTRPLTASSAALLATWVYKTAAMMQFDDPSTRAITERDLRLTKRELLPGGYVHVYAFQMESRANSMRLAHRGIFVTDPDFVGPVPDHANISSTVIAIERTGFIVTYSAFSHLGTQFVVPPPNVPGLVQLWPTPRAIAWPPPMLSDEVAELIFTYYPNPYGATHPFGL